MEAPRAPAGMKAGYEVHPAGRSCFERVVVVKEGETNF
jgi:hypothetical protein